MLCDSCLLGNAWKRLQLRRSVVVGTARYRGQVSRGLSSLCSLRMHDTADSSHGRHSKRGTQSVLADGACWQCDPLAPRKQSRTLGALWLFGASEYFVRLSASLDE